jgi:hypothetical protein
VGAKRTGFGKAGLTNSTDLSDNALKIGYYYTPDYAMNGRVDDFRVARYNANFTPPTAPFPSA